MKKERLSWSDLSLLAEVIMPFYKKTAGFSFCDNEIIFNKVCRKPTSGDLVEDLYLILMEVIDE